MTLTADLDALLATIGTAAGIPAGRDPAKIHPPCVYMDPPTFERVTLTALQATCAVWLVDESPAQAHADANLNRLHAVMNACAGLTAERATLTIGGNDFNGYRITAGTITVN